MAKFVARCSNQILGIRPSDRRVENGVVMNIPGERIHFENGVFETDDQDKIEFIRNHRLFGNSIFEEKTSKRGVQE